MTAHPDTDRTVQDARDGDFKAFLDGREAVGQAYVIGDAGPLAAISAEQDPATFFPPYGGLVQGAKEVLTTNERNAGQFLPGSETHFEILHADATGDLGYLVGIQYATVRMQGMGEAVPMNLRITEIFRRENGSWRLVHRHADSHDADRE